MNRHSASQTSCLSFACEKWGWRTRKGSLRCHPRTSRPHATCLILSSLPCAQIPAGQLARPWHRAFQRCNDLYLFSSRAKRVRSWKTTQSGGRSAREGRREACVSDGVEERGGLRAVRATGVHSGVEVGTGRLPKPSGGAPSDVDQVKAAFPGDQRDTDRCFVQAIQKRGSGRTPRPIVDSLAFRCHRRTQ